MRSYALMSSALPSRFAIGSHGASSRGKRFDDTRYSVRLFAEPEPLATRLFKISSTSYSSPSPAPPACSP